MRWLLGLVGVASILAAVVIWVWPTDDQTKVVSETSTTRSTGTTSSEQTVSKVSTTTEPGDGPSDVLLSLLFGSGAALLLTSALWDRIQEVGLPGGTSIKLAEAKVPAIGLNEVAVALESPTRGATDAHELATFMMSQSQAIIAKAKEIAEAGAPVTEVDLGIGDKWVLQNLYFLLLVLEKWTRVSLVVFTYAEANRARLFAAAGSPKRIREALAPSSPALEEAGDAVAGVALDEAGGVFFERLSKLLPPGDGPTWVTKKVLEERAYAALVFESVEIECDDEFSRDELKAILCHPLGYVSVTRKARLQGIVDRCRVALALARPAVRATDS